MAVGGDGAGEESLLTAVRLSPYASIQGNFKWGLSKYSKCSIAKVERWLAKYSRC